MEKTKIVMDYEKAYKEALKRAEVAIELAADKDLVKGVATTIFPELRESEDERIRKIIIKHFEEIANRDEQSWINLDIPYILAYLEKQKENPTDKEPKSDAEELREISLEIEKEWEDERIRNEILIYIGARQDVDLETHNIWCTYLEKQKESLHIPETCKENAEYFTQCGDNRFELIGKAKRDIIAETNIGSSKDEMKVLDSFLFRAWQMGWLGKYDVIVPEQKPVEVKDPSIEELEAHSKALHDFKVFAAKQAEEHHISFVHDFEWNNFCGEILSYFNEQKYTPKFKVGDKLMSNGNHLLTYKILEVGHINELGNPEYKVEIFTDGKLDEPHNIHYMECRRVDEWGKLKEQKPEEWSEEDRKMIDHLIEEKKNLRN